MKQRLLPIILALSLVALIIMGCIGMVLVRRYIPSNEVIDKKTLLDIEENQVALILDNFLQEEKGIYYEDQIYLSISWVNKNINERFYWDDMDKILVYTLPESIVYADMRTLGSTGKPLLLSQGEEIYLSLSLILSYSNVQADVFDQDDCKRVYLDTKWQDRQMADVKLKGKMRVSSDIHHPIISELIPGEKVRVLEQIDEWSKIINQEGFMGYIENKSLSDISLVTQVSRFQEPIYTNISLDNKVNLAFHQVLSREANETFDRMIENTENLNVIAPTWFFLVDNAGNYQTIADKNYVEKAHQKGLQVWAVIDNFNRGENVRSEILFAKTSTRQKLIESLMKDLKEYKLDGINVDIESIKPEAGPHYVQFLRELSVACRKEQKILSIDNYTPSASSFFYNRAEQAIIADYVIVMGYDEHYAGGEAGSVASIDFVQKGIEDTLKLVPKEKLINAVPFYTRIWIEENGKVRSEAFGMEQAKKWVEEHQVELYWQEELGQYYGELLTDDGRKIVWMEDERSLKMKVDLVKKYDLAGIACWKLGFEPKTIWEIMNINQ